MRAATIVAAACLACGGAAPTVAEAPWRIAGFAGALQPRATAPVQVERTVHLMGTWATLVVEAADRAAGLEALERMVGVIERTEASLSTWRADSVLGALNRQPVGEPFGLPPALCGLWPRLARWHGLTGGAFDPAVGRLVEAWGLRAGGAVPEPEVVGAARAATGLAHFRFDAGTCRVIRTVDATLDAGAFGKGEALRRLVAVSAGGDPWMVDFGGQIAVGGGPREPVGRWPSPIPLGGIRRRWRSPSRPGRSPPAPPRSGPWWSTAGRWPTSSILGRDSRSTGRSPSPYGTRTRWPPTSSRRRST